MVKTDRYIPTSWLSLIKMGGTAQLDIGLEASFLSGRLDYF